MEEARRVVDERRGSEEGLPSVKRTASLQTLQTILGG